MIDNKDTEDPPQHTDMSMRSNARDHIITEIQAGIILPDNDTPATFQKNVILHKTNDTPMNWDQIPKTNLELTLPPEKQHQFNQCIQEAQRLIRTYIPDAITKESTRFFIRNSHSETFEPSGEYLGAIRQQNLTHCIAINMPKSLAQSKELYSIEEQEILINVLSHELLHQKHAETVGSAALFGVDLGTIPSTLPITYDLIHELRSRHLPILLKSLNLDLAVVEGIATIGEMHLLSKRDEELKINGNSQQLATVQKRRGDLFKRFRQCLNTSKRSTSHYFSDSYTIGTVKLMKGLSRKYGIEHLLKIIPHIDLDKCRKVTPEEFNQICDNPQLLPGLKAIDFSSSGQFLNSDRT